MYELGWNHSVTGGRKHNEERTFAVCHMKRNPNEAGAKNKILVLK